MVPQSMPASARSLPLSLHLDGEVRQSIQNLENLPLHGQWHVHNLVSELDLQHLEGFFEPSEKCASAPVPRHVHAQLCQRAAPEGSWRVLPLPNQLCRGITTSRTQSRYCLHRMWMVSTWCCNTTVTSTTLSMGWTCGTSTVFSAFLITRTCRCDKNTDVHSVLVNEIAPAEPRWSCRICHVLTDPLERRWSTYPDVSSVE